MLKTKFICVLIFCSCIASCRKKELLPPNTPNVSKPNAPLVDDTTSKFGAIKVKVANYVGDSFLKLGIPFSYLMPNGDELTINKFNFYLTNIVLIDKTGHRIPEENSYHLIMAERPGSLEFSISSVPLGSYKAIEFLIGVDSARNVSGAQVGALDPKFGMFWSWSNGYIMAMLEGVSPQSSTSNSSVIYHIAGFKGKYNAIRKVTLSLGVNALVDSSSTSIVTLKSDIRNLFPSPGFPGFNVLPVISDEGEDAVNFANNYSKIFSVLSVENP